MVYHLRLLGGLRIEGPDGPVTGEASQRHRLALLAVLAASPGRTLSRDKIVGLLWPERDDTHARQLLNLAVHQIRRALGAEAIVTAGADLTLDRRLVRPDLLDFEAALERDDVARAADLHAGPFLDGFHLPNAGPFEEWIAAQRERIRARHTDTLRRIGHAAEARGEWGEAARCWRELGRLDPFNADAVLRLLRAMAAAGDRTGAAHQADAAIAALRAEDIEPDAALLALTESLRAAPPADDDPAALPIIAAAGPRPAMVVEDAAAGTPADVGGWRRIALGVIVGALTLAAAIALLLPGKDDGYTDVPTLAVLPFANLSGPADADFVDGLTGEIRASLARASGLALIGRVSALRFRAVDRSPSAIGRQLGVAFLLDGAIGRDRLPNGVETVRVTPRLLDAATGRQLWADTLVATVDGVISANAGLPARVTAAVLRALQPERATPAPARYVPDADAYNYFLQGRAIGQRDLTEANFRAEAAMYERAIERDSGFAAAWAGLASALTSLYWYHHDQSPEVRDRARRAIRRALELAPDLPEAHVVQGYVRYHLDRDYGGATVAFARALEGDPRNAEARMAIGYLQRRLGQWDAALASQTAAVELEPLSYSYAVNLAITHLLRREYVAARRLFDRGLTLDPAGDTFFFIALSHQLEGDTAATRATVDGAVARYGADEVARMLVAHSDVPASWIARFPDARLHDALLRLRPPAGGPAAGSQHLARALVLAQIGRRALARASFDSARTAIEAAGPGAAAQDARRTAHLAIALAGLGRHDEAIRTGLRATGLLPVATDAWDGAEVEQDLIEVYVRTGRHPEAVRLLEKHLAMPSTLSVPLLRIDPLFDPLRDDPAFRRIVARGPAEPRDRAAER